MVSVGMVWDRTTEVITGRFAILVSIALLLLFTPPAVRAAIDAVAGTSMTLKLVAGVISIGVLVAAIVAGVALTAVATDPAVDQSTALAIGGRRFGPMLGIGVVIGIVLCFTAVPGIFLLATSGFDVDRAQAGLSQETLDAGRAGAALLYFCVLGVVWLWVSARLVPLPGVIVNERRGLGAIRRAFALSRGSSFKLIGVMILYAIVLIVVLMAAIWVTGLIARLIAGSEAPALVAFFVALVTAVVTAIFSVLQSVFSGQFYIAAREVLDRA